MSSSADSFAFFRRKSKLSASVLQRTGAAASALFYCLETGYFEDAGFLKLRELSLTYFAPAMWASRIGASALSLTISGRNLATWTNYKGPDPEVSQSGQFNFSVADFLTQPPVRSFVARVNVTLRLSNGRRVTFTRSFLTCGK